MTVRLSARLAAAGISAALVAGGVTLAASAPAHADTSASATYDCTLAGVPVGSIDLAAVLPDAADADGSATVPITMTLSGAMALGSALNGALDTLAGALATAGFPLSLEPVSDGVSTLTGTLAAVAQPGSDSLPVAVPSTLDLSGVPLLGELCTLTTPADGVLGTLPIPGGSESTPTPTPTPKPTPKPAPKPTTTKKPTKKPAKHAATMTAKSVKWKIHHTAHPKVRIQVKTQGHGAKGKVVAHVGKHLVGQGWLKNGRLTLVLKKLARGKRSVRINYLGNSAVRATHRWVSYKIIK